MTFQRVARLFRALRAPSFIIARHCFSIEHSDRHGRSTERPPSLPVPLSPAQSNTGMVSKIHPARAVGPHCGSGPSPVASRPSFCLLGPRGPVVDVPAPAGMDPDLD